MCFAIMVIQQVVTAIKLKNVLWTKKLPKYPLFVLLWTFSLLYSTNGLHIQGTFNPKVEFFHFLAKFGFQKTELRRRDDSQGFIYGNVTLVGQNDSFISGMSSYEQIIRDQFYNTYHQTKEHSRYFVVRGSIILLLTSCLTGLDLTKLVNLYLIQHMQSN